MATDVVTLAQVRTHLRMSDGYTQDDEMLSDIFIPACNDVVQRECAEVLEKQYNEYYDGGDLTIWTRHIPILSVELVEEGWGWVNFDLSYVQVNSVGNPEGTINPIFAYSIDEPEQGQISRRFGASVPAPFMAGEANIHIVYTTGLEVIPGSITLASLELINHWYQGAMQRAGSGASAYGYDADVIDSTRESAISTINQGVPYRILEMLKPNRRTPIIG